MTLSHKSPSCDLREPLMTNLAHIYRAGRIRSRALRVDGHCGQVASFVRTAAVRLIWGEERPESVLKTKGLCLCS